MQAIDISRYIEAKSDQITADDLIAGPRTFRIARVEDTGGEQPISIHMEGHDGKPFKPCKGMRRLLAQMWGIDAAQWAGRTLTLFRDPDVMFGGKTEGGVRVAALSHIEAPQTVPIRVSRGRAKNYNVTPIAAEAPPKAKQTAEEWADEQAGAAKVCASLDSLADLMARGAKPMVKLERDKPELWAKVNAAYAAKRAELDSDDAGFAALADEAFGADAED